VFVGVELGVDVAVGVGAGVGEDTVQVGQLNVIRSKSGAQSPTIGL
jgi:hypothetical protein